MENLLHGGVSRELDSKISEIAKFARACNVIAMVTPRNADEEKEHWLDCARNGSFDYIPDFRYKKDLLTRVDSLGKNLESLGVELDSDDLAAQLLTARVRELRQTVKMAQSMLAGDDEQTTAIANQKFGGAVDLDAYEVAQRQALALQKGEGESAGVAKLTDAEIAALEGMKIDADGIADWFRWAVDVYGFDFEVIVDDIATAIDVCDRNGVIAIPKKRVVSGRKLVTLLKHEIEGHARDSQNGKILFGGLGGGALRCDDDVLYEGHAMWSEKELELQLFGKCMATPLPWYTLVLYMAERGCSVEEIAENIFEQRLKAVKGKREKALKQTWTTLYRTLFRGRTQQADNGYYFLKDKAYLEGYLFAKSLPENQKFWLSAGTVSIDELRRVMRENPDFTEADLPYADLGLAEQVAQMLLEPFPA